MIRSAQVTAVARTIPFIQDLAARAAESFQVYVGPTDERTSAQAHAEYQMVRADLTGHLAFTIRTVLVRPETPMTDVQVQTLAAVAADRLIERLEAL